LFYLKQHLLFIKLINIVINVSALLTLLQDTNLRNYQKFQTTINLVFTINNITNRLIQYKINKNIENFLDYLSMQTIIDLKICKKSMQRLYRN